MSEGMKCYSEAEKIGNKVGILNVGVGYLLGIGFEKNFEEGIELLKRVGRIEEKEIWMMRELSNPVFFSGDIKVDMSGLFIVWF